MAGLRAFSDDVDFSSPSFLAVFLTEAILDRLRNPVEERFLDVVANVLAFHAD